MRKDQVLLAPIVTEKSVQQPGKYTFQVDQAATKSDVKSAVEDFYGVEVVSVNIINTAPKYRLMKGKYTAQKKAVQKKAIVTLKAGTTLEFNAYK